MTKSLTADDLLPLVACLTPQERLRLLRLISARRDEKDAYSAFTPTREEFSSDEEPLSWDAEGWEEVG